MKDRGSLAIMNDESREPFDEDAAEKLQQLSELAETVRVPEAPGTEDFEDRLAAIEAGSAKARATHARATGKGTSPTIEGQVSLNSVSADRGLAFGLSAALAFIGLPIAFYLAGLGVASAGGPDIKNGLAVVGVVFGSGYAYYLLKRGEKGS